MRKEKNVRDLIKSRALRKFEDKGVKVTKLFAKHIKLQEAIENCKKFKMNIGVGTPKRIIDLLDNGKLGSNSQSPFSSQQAPGRSRNIHPTQTGKSIGCSLTLLVFKKKILCSHRDVQK